MPDFCPAVTSHEPREDRRPRRSGGVKLRCAVAAPDAPRISRLDTLEILATPLS